MGRLSEYEFQDLYMSANGEFLILAPEKSADLEIVPDDLQDDTRVLFAKVYEQERDRREFRVEHDQVQYRVVSMPAMGEKWWCMRKCLPQMVDINSLGLGEALTNELVQIGVRSGLILVVGATGSGKTVTASALMRAWLTSYSGVGVTVEDPAELPLQGKWRSGRCWQFEVEGKDYGEELVRVLRMRPRFIMVGEIRTPGVAAEANRAGNNGHLVVGTMHAGSVMQGVQRFLELAEAASGSVARQSFASGLVGVVHQQLRMVDRGAQRQLSARERGGLSAGYRLDAKSVFTLAQSACPVREKIRAGRLTEIEQDIERQAQQREQRRAAPPRPPASPARQVLR